jgi:indole-3-glycerol phosphate synthase
MTTVLDTIVAHKHREIEAARGRCPDRELENRALIAPPTRGFREALEKSRGVQIIAEIKKASPSAGILRTDFDPVAIARTYEHHGAACVSVLTDEHFFQGSLADLELVRAAIKLPVLRKDFIVDPYQVLEARASGADAVLLIAEILDPLLLSRLLHRAAELGMDALVELYEPENLARVVDSGANLIGVNNRNLRNFTTRLEHTLELVDRIPKDCCLVSESGIRSRADILRLEQAGVRAVLVGETLMRAPDIGAKLDELRGIRE